MTITFPRDFPMLGAFSGECTFDLQYQQSRSLTGGAIPNVADVGPALWVGTWQTQALTRADFATWSAWLSSLRVGLRTFKGRPALWRWPRSYPTGFAGISFDGTGNLSAIGVNRDTITVDQVPTGFALKAGDYCSIVVGSRQHLHRILEDATASAGAVTLTVEPTIRPDAVTAVAVLFEAPYCEMVLTEQPSLVRRGVRGGSISFGAQQVLL